MRVLPRPPSREIGPESYPNPLEEREDKFVRDCAKDGARIGFRAGCVASIIGIPVNMCLANMQSRKRGKARTAKKRLKLWAVLCFPGVLVGGVGAGLGAAIGAAIARVSLGIHKKK